MHDIRAIRDDPESFNAAMLRRGLPDASDPLMRQDQLRRHCIRQLQEKQAQRTELSKQIAAGRRRGADTAELEVEAVRVRINLEAFEEGAAKAEADTRRLLEALPNRLDPEVPDGADESANRIESGTLQHS